MPLGSYLSAVALSTKVQAYQVRLDGTFPVDPVWVGEESTASTG